MAKCLAIIPARGGSKRIPRKNIKNFMGYPIIKYSIDCALKSNCFDEVMVSTDDKEIAEVSEKYGASIPFYRKQETSNDYAMLADVIVDVLLDYKKNGKTFDYVCCILATAPFINKNRIVQGFEILQKNDADSVLPVTRFSYPIQRALKISDEKLQMFWPENYDVRSQDLTPAYQDSGQFYWIKTKSFLEQKKLFAKKTFPLVIPEIEVQDIDTQEDWVMAESKYKMLNKQI